VLLSLGVALLFLHDFVLVPLHADARAGGAPPDSSPPLSAYLEQELERLQASATAAERARGFVIAPDPRLSRGHSASFDARPFASRSWSCAARRSWESTRDLLGLRAFWRALWWSVCCFWISKQWGDLDQLLPAYLERQFGESVPVYRVHSINMWICMLGPSLVAGLTSHIEALRCRTLAKRR